MPGPLAVFDESGEAPILPAATQATRTCSDL